MFLSKLNGVYTNEKGKRHSYKNANSNLMLINF
jgi:hypothetical protein